MVMAAVHLFLPWNGVNGGYSLRGTSVRMGATSARMAVRDLRNLVLDAAGGAVAFGPLWGSACALRIDAERPGDLR